MNRWNGARVLLSLLASGRRPGLLCALATAGALACGGGGTSETPASSGSVEVFSWWTAGGEADGLNALVQLFQSQNPTVTFINAATQGGAGDNARATLTQRLAENQPPDSFQVHGGKELLSSWVKPPGASDTAQSKMEILNGFFAQQGWNGKFPQALLDIVSLNGNIYSVPVDVHRGNVLFYNVPLFKSANLKPPSTMAEFITVATSLKSKGVTPVAIGTQDPFSVAMIFENQLVAEAGPEFAKAYWAGQKSSNDPAVLSAIDDLAVILNYTNADSATLTWDTAAQLVMDGSAAMTFMGDWVKGYYQSKGYVPQQDFDVVPSMGTTGTFIVVSDTFGLPKGAPSRDHGLAFLSILGSQQGQDLFNPKKGSIPPRLDADLTKYDAMAKATIADFKTGKLVPSMSNGSAADPDYTAAANNAFGAFFKDRNKNLLAGFLKVRAPQLLQ